MNNSPQVIYKILSQEEWEDAQKTGVYRGSAMDMNDGFIHFSTKDQVPQILEKYFKGQKDLLQLTIDTRKINGDLRWEVSPRSGKIYPHLYGELPIQAVVTAKPVHKL